MKSDYSEKEFAMIKELSPHWANIIEADIHSNLMPPSVLEILAMECFREDRKGPEVESLRRCMKALKACKPYRMTDEYDDLINLGGMLIKL
jgi:hypothetical protein